MCKAPSSCFDRFIAPTILLDAPLDSMIMTEEIFGPLLPIMTVKTLLCILVVPCILTLCIFSETLFTQVDKVEDSFSIIKSRPKPLSAYLFTKNKKFEEKFVMTISTGGILINDTTLQVIDHLNVFMTMILASISLIMSICYIVLICYAGCKS